MRSPALLICTLAALLGGCTSGFIYSDVTEPVGSNMDHTVVSDKSGSSSSSAVIIPTGRINLIGAWSDRSIGEAAKNGPISVIHYADQRTLSILGGLWSRTTVTVYGD
jgi:hypothetical protein